MKRYLCFHDRQRLKRGVNIRNQPRLCDVSVLIIIRYGNKVVSPEALTFRTRLPFHLRTVLFSVRKSLCSVPVFVINWQTAPFLFPFLMDFQIFYQNYEFHCLHFQLHFLCINYSLQCLCIYGAVYCRLNVSILFAHPLLYMFPLFPLQKYPYVLWHPIFEKETMSDRMYLFHGYFPYFANM